MSTTHQDEALKKATEIIGEHFPCYILVVLEEADTEEVSSANVSYEGGHYCALGLLEAGRLLMDEIRAEARAEDEDNEDQPF